MKFRYNIDQILEIMNNDLGDDYSIGVHNIRVNSNNFFKGKYKIIRSIRDIYHNGWRFKWYNDIYFTVSFLGFMSDIIKNNDDKKDYFELYNYWREKDVSNIIVAVPNHIVINGKKYFVGILENDHYLVANMLPHGANLLKANLLDHRVPSEFVYGVYSRHKTKNEDSEEFNANPDIPEGIDLDKVHKRGFVFRKNPNHISNKSKEEQESFYKSFLEESGLSVRDLENAQLGNTNNEIINNTFEQKIVLEDKRKAK